MTLAYLCNLRDGIERRYDGNGGLNDHCRRDGRRLTGLSHGETAEREGAEEEDMHDWRHAAVEVDGR